MTLAVLACPLDGHGQTSVLGSYAFGDATATRWRLPRRLREISGLTTAHGDRLYAHDDERAVIYEIDYTAGELHKAWAMGDRPAPGDFEGIAYAAERFYLVTSDGRIYESREGEDDDRMLFNTYGTGVGHHCEVEGLAFEPSDGTLLLACKTPREEALEPFVAIYRFSLERHEVIGDPLRIPRDAIAGRIDEKSFHTSGIERDPRTGHYVLVAAQQSAIAEITPDGTVLAVVDFKREEHRQIEGITFLPDGTLVVADEGGSGRARLTLYPPRSR